MLTPHPDFFGDPKIAGDRLHIDLGNSQFLCVRYTKDYKLTSAKYGR